ncbi:MAG: trypsin-like serine peptidase, partial [Planctomycetota bacterium]
MYGLDHRTLLLLVVTLATPVFAQSTLDFPMGEFTPYYLDSGSLGNLEQSSSVVYAATVTVEDAIWLRLYFDSVELDDGSFIRMTSALDHEVQELDAGDIAMWKNSSAYFNGDTVYLELIAGPETTGNRAVLDRVAVHIDDGLRACGVDGCGYCGADTRVPSNELWTGRLMPVGCTGSVFNSASCVVTAGHCAGGNLLIQFNVPNSQANCNMVNPPVIDQFPIMSQSFNSGGVGNDWAVMTTGNNSAGQQPYERYGELRPISSALGNPGDDACVWGYGVDDSPSPTRNQTQQVDCGTINSRLSTYYTINVDATYGNSGSGVIRNDEIIGIVTHCPCPNVATRVDVTAFVV